MPRRRRHRPDGPARSGPRRATGRSAPPATGPARPARDRGRRESTRGWAPRRASSTVSGTGTPSAARKVLTTGLGVPATAPPSAAAYSRPGVATGGTNTTTSASTPAPSPVDSAADTASANWAGVAPAPTSTGSPTTRRPWLSAASTASSPNALELPTTATRSSDGQRLVGQQCGAVEELGDGIHPDDPGLLEQRGHRVLVDRRPGHTTTRGVATALDRHHRLGAGQLARDAAELAGVAEPSPGTAAPRRWRGRWTSTASGRCRRRRPGCPPETKEDSPRPRCARRGEDGDAQGARLAEETHPPARGQRRCEGGVQAHRRVGVGHAQGAGGRPPACRGAGPRAPGGARRPGRRRPVSANPVETMTSARTPLARQSSSTASTPAAGTATTARSTSSGISRTET